eukprot:31439-Pelagococcus_subviridis.AAC.26
MFVRVVDSIRRASPAVDGAILERCARRRGRRSRCGPGRSCGSGGGAMATLDQIALLKFRRQRSSGGARLACTATRFCC